MPQSDVNIAELFCYWTARFYLCLWRHGGEEETLLKLGTENVISCALTLVTAGCAMICLSIRYRDKFNFIKLLLLKEEMVRK